MYYCMYTHPFYQVCHLCVYPELVWSNASKYISNGYLYLCFCIATELISPIPYCISCSDFPEGFCLSLLSAASAVMGHDLWLVITSCCVHTHTHTNSHIYLHIFCHLYCRHFVGSSYIRGLVSAGYTTSTGTLLSSFVFSGIILLGHT
jgi:hypothetical protein